MCLISLYFSDKIISLLVEKRIIFNTVSNSSHFLGAFYLEKMKWKNRKNLK